MSASNNDTVLKTVVAAAILLGLGGIAYFITANPPEQQRGQREPARLVIEARELQPRDYQIMLESYGTVQPRTQTVLVSQVSGQIVTINPAFRDGGFFEQGDTLIAIDKRDFQANVRIASAGLLDARQALAEAQARSEQARTDWQRLGNEGEPTPLVLREPQLAAARARVESAEASVRRAELDLSRTAIRAPYAGRVLRQSVDIGQVVNANTQLGEIYATDVIEVRLPLRNRDLTFVDLPEQYRFDSREATQPARVAFRSDLGEQEIWEGDLVRTEGAIDEVARQLHVAAQIQDPYGAKADGRTPLKIGQYVTAKIAGKTINDALVIDNRNIYQGTYVYVVEDGVLDRRSVRVLWQNDKDSVISDGLRAGDQIVTTQLGQVTSGTRVSIAGAQRRDQSAKPRAGSAAQ